MKQITIISGKGGTGKTTITAALAAIAKSKVMADCDVDAADLHLLIKPTIIEKETFIAGKSVLIDKSICNQCGFCKQICKFQAINENYEIDPIACEGCAACYFNCPTKAISLKDNIAGEYYISDTSYGKMVHAKLNTAEDNSGKLVAKVREEAKKQAIKENADYIIIDGPPGIGCPVNASITGVDLVLVITEPTLSGIHDLERVLKLAQHFKIDAKVIINKYDINLENTQKIETICEKIGFDCIEKIPYLEVVVEALVAGKTIVDYKPDNIVSLAIKNVWETIK
jgi:MinD superfamily P-loop ATPase